jgi:uncharacterized protein YraI
VDGCINGYRWCDVTVGPERGWVYAGNIIYAYQGAPVPLINYGAVIGIGIIAFSLGDYWDNHYRTRPWYPQRQHWIDRPRTDSRPDTGQLRPLSPRPPPRHDDVQRPPHEQGPAATPHPEQRPPSAGAHRPTAGTQPPHQEQPTAATQQSPQAQAPARKPRPPQSQPPKETQRPPHDQPRGGDKRLLWDERMGDGKK